MTLVMLRPDVSSRISNHDLRLSVALFILVLSGVPVLASATDARRCDHARREVSESFCVDASQGFAIQVPGFRSLEPNLSLRCRSSRHDDLLDVAWTLGDLAGIEAVAPRYVQLQLQRHLSFGRPEIRTLQSRDGKAWLYHRRTYAVT